MSDELFPAEAVSMDSPRLAWMKKHGIVTLKSEVEPVCWFAGKPAFPVDDSVGWFMEEMAANGREHCGEGATEDEAITGLARCWGLRLWNEEGV